MEAKIRKNRYVRGYTKDGKPIFKKHIKDINILTKRSAGDKILFIVMFIIFLMHCITLSMPMLWMLMSSFKESMEYAMGDPFALPAVWEFHNYVEAVTMLSMGQTTFIGMLFNSIWYTVLRTALNVFMPAITGYVLSKYRFKGRNIIYGVAIFSMTVPIVGSAAADVKLYGDLGLYDTPFYVIIASLGAFNTTFLIYYGFFKSVSWSYAEAAQIDGGGHFTIFFKVMLPQAIPIILTYAVTISIGHWNDYQTIIMYLPSYPTLSSGLFEYEAIATRGVDYPRYYAGLFISMIPTITIFAIFSGKIMTSISVGGLKG